MYDFWYALGTSIIDPDLLKAIQGAPPFFEFCPRLTIVTKNGQPALRHGPSTGNLKSKPTSDVRIAISAYLRKISSSAPPVGMYCAGRFCQLINIPRFQSTNDKSSLHHIIDHFHTAYLYALNGGQPSTLPAFPALVGLCPCDGNVVNAMQQYPGGDPGSRAEVMEILGEFGIRQFDDGNRDWYIIRRFVNSPDFSIGTTLFMGGDNNPWFETGNTLEQSMFWNGTSEYAIP
jgi:hypothetical protein